MNANLLLIPVFGLAATALVIGMDMWHIGVLFLFSGLLIWQGRMNGYNAPYRFKYGRLIAACTTYLLPTYTIFLIWWNEPGNILMTIAVLCCFIRNVSYMTHVGKESIRMRC